MKYNKNYNIQSVIICRGRYRLCESCDFATSNYQIYTKSENIIKEVGENSTWNYQQNQKKSDLSQY